MTTYFADCCQSEASKMPYLAEYELSAHASELAVEQPVEDGVPEAVAERKPGDEEVQGRRRPGSRTGHHYLLDSPRGYQDDEAQRHGSQRS